MKAVVITGVSSGIGLGIAQALSVKGVHVFGSVRNEDDARNVGRSLQNFTPLLLDVTDQSAVRAAADMVRTALKGRKLWGLVNNAGIAIPGPILHQPLAEFRKQIEVNLIGAFVVSQTFAPLLGADSALGGSPGRIVNISSLGGKIGSPLLAGYCSSKHGLEGLSESLRRELVVYGIDVVIIGPGAVRTPIWDKAHGGDARYAGTNYGPAMKALGAMMERASRDGLSVDRVGELVHRVLTSRRPGVRYALAPSYVFDWLLPRFLPARWIDSMFARKLELIG